MTEPLASFAPSCDLRSASLERDDLDRECAGPTGARVRDRECHAEMVMFGQQSPAGGVERDRLGLAVAGSEGQ